MLFHELASECAPQVPLDLLAGIVSIESGFEPLATRTGGRRVVGSTPGESMGFVIGAADLGVAGGAGLAGVTEAMARAHKVTLIEAFDACTNFKIAGAKLAKLLADAGDGPAVMSAERRAVQLYFVPASHQGWNAGAYWLAVDAERAKLKASVYKIEVRGAAPVKPVRTAGDAPQLPPRTDVPPKAVVPESVKSERPKWDVFGASGAARAAIQKGKS
jgi:type IV secretion system protein VirB1